jgi:hypothetical protein
MEATKCNVNAAFSVIPEVQSSLVGTGDGISSPEPFLPNPINY